MRKAPEMGSTPPPPLTMLQKASATLGRALYRARLRPGLRLPDFLGIGAQKSGTTWLWEMLRRHPQVFMPAVKELHFFDLHLEQGVGRYAAHFAAAGDKTAGEITPAYAILPARRVAVVRSLVPRAKLLYLMRNPIERAWSHALMELVTYARRPYESVRPEEFEEHFRSPASLERGDHGAVLERWLRCYPRECLWVGFFEDIATRPRELLAEVFAHLELTWEVDWSWFPTQEVVFKGEGVPLPAEFRQRLVEIYRPRIEALAERCGSRVLQWIYG